MKRSLDWNCSVLAALLHCGAILNIASMGFLMLALMLVYFAVGVNHWKAAALAFAAIIFAFIQFFYALRTAFDATLFSHMSGVNDLAGVDAALVKAGYIKQALPEKKFEARIAGARRLFRRQIFALAAEFIVLIAGGASLRLL